MAKSKIENKPQELNFEEALHKLEIIVNQMEAGELPLEEALSSFSEGVRLSGICLTKLNAAEKVIDKMIQEEQGTLTETALVLKGDAENA
ncbi:MAG: exodeoxyribonuclease VII small subunit [Negativicutes bacterium]